MKIKSATLLPVSLYTTNKKGEPKEVHNFGSIVMYIDLLTKEGNINSLKVILLHTQKKTGKNFFKSRRLDRWQFMLNYKLLGMEVSENDISYRQGVPMFKQHMAKKLRSLITGLETVQIELGNWNKIKDNRGTSSRAKTFKNMNRVTISNWYEDVEKCLVK